jgi:hypothetical protein
MSASKFVRAVPAAPDTNPNTTAPLPDLVFAVPVPQGGYLPAVWCAALGGGCSVQLWAFDATTSSWLTVGAATALTAGAHTALAGAPIGPLYLQVTVVGTATRLVAGWY